MLQSRILPKGNVMAAPKPDRPSAGYSVLEVMLVMGIVGILSAVGASQLAPRSAPAVRTLMDEVEGALGTAHQAAAATGQDIALVTWGTWDAGSPLFLAHGDATLSDENIQSVATGTASASSVGSQGSTVATAFRYLPGDRVQAGARIVALGSTQWTNALQKLPGGGKNDDITTVQPFADNSASGGTRGLMHELVVDTNRLFPEDLHRVLVSGSIATTPLEDFDACFAVNTRGAFLTLAEAARRICDGGRIVAISTNLTQQTFPGYGVYAASKAAVEQMVRTLAREMGGRGITVNAVSPGPTDTDMMSEAARASAPGITPLGRVGLPQDIADVVAFLASDQGRWITGQILGANGGIV